MPAHRSAFPLALVLALGAAPAGAGEKPAAGADPRAFWSFQPLKRPAPPAPKDLAWCRTPVDRFIRMKLEEKGLAPNAEADRRILIRRATFDLTGLPPTPEQVETFL